MERDVFGRVQNLLERRPHRSGPGFDVGGRRDDVVIEHAHAEPDLGRLADAPADPAETDDAEAAAEDVAAGEGVAGVVVEGCDGGGS